MVCYLLVVGLIISVGCVFDQDFGDVLDLLWNLVSSLVWVVCESDGLFQIGEQGEPPLY